MNSEQIKINKVSAGSEAEQGHIPYGRQEISQEDIDAVLNVLRADYLTQGPEISKFEQAFAEYVGSKYAVAVANGTAALHLCTLALGVKPGDNVITTPITFAATANCVKYCGGTVEFSDIDPETYLLDIEEVRKKIKSAPAGYYKGIIPVDFAGRAVNLEAYREIAAEHNLWLIEDACHAPGAYFTDSAGIKQTCGNGNFADLAIFSFHPVKHITSGEGGMITTNNADHYEKLRVLRTHGIVKDEKCYLNDLNFALGRHDENEIIKQPLEKNSNWPGWYMEMQTLGYNYRLTDFQAALGMSQLKRAKAGVLRRMEIAATYYNAFKSIPQITDNNHEVAFTHGDELNHQHSNGHAFHLYVIEVEDRLGLYNYLRAKGIYPQIHYIPLHLMPYYRNLANENPPFLKHAEAYYKQCISLPMFPALSDEEQKYVIETIRNYYDQL